MDDFLPSEVARLVLGYLKDVKCIKSWETFLGENPSLEEYYYLYKNGTVYCTNVGEKSLLEILSFYRSLKKYGKKIVNEIKRCEKEYNSNPDTRQDIIDEIANMVSLTFQKYVSLSIDKCDRPDSNLSSNIDSNVTEYTDVQNQISGLSETNKYADECNEITPCDLSAAVKQTSKINEIGDSRTNIFALQQVPSNNNSSCLNSECAFQIIKSELDSHVSDNEMSVGDTSRNISALQEVPSSSCLNSEHDFQIIKSELDSNASDNEMNVSDTSTNISALQEVPSNNNSSCLNSECDFQIIKRELDSNASDNEMIVDDTSTIISLNTPDLQSIKNMPLGHSNTKNKFVSDENNQSSPTKEYTLNVQADLPSLANSSHSVENIAAVTTDTEIIDKIETANENPVFVVLPNEINCLNTMVPSEKQGVWEANGNTIVNESHNVLKSTDDFILINNPQYSMVISPPDQSSAVLSPVPGFTMPNFSSDLSAQKNIQYQIVLNTPINWNVPTANGLSLLPSRRLSFVPSLTLSNISKSSDISPKSTTVVPTPLLSNVPKQVAFAPSSSILGPTLPLPNASSQASASSTSLPLSNISKSLDISPKSTTVVPTPLLSHVPKQVAFAPSSSILGPTLPLPNASSQASASSTAVSNAANFETTVCDNLHDNTRSVPIVKKSITDLKMSNPSKQKTMEKKNGKGESKSTTGRRPYTKRLPKRKRRPLFGSIPKPKEAPLAEKIPVLSTSESPCKTASNVVTEITDDFADQCKSPVLKLLMTSANELLKPSNSVRLSHARYLDFNSKSAANEENNKLLDNNSENVKRLPEMLVRNEVQNSKPLINGNVHNEQCTSQVTNKIPDCGEISKRRTNDDTTSDCKKAKLQKQCKREKITSKKIITPEKAKRINVSSVSPKRCFKLKTYENLNKIKSREIVKENAVKELDRKGSDSQNKKVTPETVIGTVAERNKSPRRNYELLIRHLH